MSGTVGAEFTARSWTSLAQADPAKENIANAPRAKENIANAPRAKENIVNGKNIHYNITLHFLHIYY